MNDLFVRSVTFKWDEVPRDSYLHDISPIRNLSSLVFSKNVTFFVGENGTGKSTLLEAIAVAFGFLAILILGIMAVDYNMCKFLQNYG